MRTGRVDRSRPASASVCQPPARTGGGGYCGNGRSRAGVLARFANVCCDACPSEVKVPAHSTIHAILDRHGLVARVKRSSMHTEGTPLSAGLRPNVLWCTDYKGEFKLGNQRYCYPLTVTDHASPSAAV